MRTIKKLCLYYGIPSMRTASFHQFTHMSSLLLGRYFLYNCLILGYRDLSHLKRSVGGSYVSIFFP
jgi:hypothetical protein